MELQPTDWSQLIGFIGQFFVIAMAILFTIGIYAGSIRKMVMNARQFDKNGELDKLWDVIGDAVLTAERLYKLVQGAGPEKAKWVRDYIKAYCDARGIDINWDLVDKMIEQIYTQKKSTGELEKAKLL